MVCSQAQLHLKWGVVYYLTLESLLTLLAQLHNKNQLVTTVFREFVHFWKF